jgi:hypothetical protein
MKAQNRIWLLVALIVAFIIGYITWIFVNTTVDWSIHYSHQSKQPYGTKFIHQLLKEKYSKENFKVSKQSLDELFKSTDTSKVYDYVRIGDFPVYDSADVAALFQFAGKGNNLFIANARIQDVLLDTLFGFIEIVEEEDDSLEVVDSTCIDDRFNDSIILTENNINIEEVVDSVLGDLFDISDWLDVQRPYFKKNKSKKIEVTWQDSASKTCSFYRFDHLDTIKNNWRFLNLDFLSDLDSLEFRVLSQSDSKNIIMLHIPYGDGHIYLHENPIMFTNVQLLSEERLAYSEKAFAYLNGDAMIWDIHIKKRNSRRQGPPTEDESNSPLSYFLAHPPLRWSIYLSLLGALLFIAFKAKRKQKYIQVLDVKSNNSLEYAEMMGQLYFKEQNHGYIAAQMWRKFSDFVKERYSIYIKENEMDWMIKLEEKSNIPQARLRGIYLAQQNAKRENFSSDDLMNFYNKLQYFYSNCK